MESCPNSISLQQNCIHEEFMEWLLQMEVDDHHHVNSDVALDDIGNGGNIYMISHEYQENMVISTEARSYGSDENQELMSLTDLLLSGANAIEASNFPLASNAISRISTILLNKGEGEENPFNLIVYYLTEGLSSKWRNDSELILFNEFVKRDDQIMSIFLLLQELSPYMKFAQFTANQAILEASQKKKEVHIIDFDIMKGIQWPPLMADLAQRQQASFRLTAIVSDSQNAEFIKQTGRRLAEFADTIGLIFRFDQIMLEHTENGDDILGIIEFGHTVIANFMIHQLQTSKRNFSLVKLFLNLVTKLPVEMIVVVEEELFNFVEIPSKSFSDFISNALQYYTAFSDSLLHSFKNAAGTKLFAKEIMGLRISDCVRNFPVELAEKKLWKDEFSSLLSNFKTIPMSYANVSQAKLLTGLFGRGYWVQHENRRLSLCWKFEPLITASVWVPMRK